MGAFHTRIGGLVAGTIVAVVLTGCSNDAKGTGDAPVQDRRGEDSATQVYNFPDGFGNLATKCVGHGYRAYVTTNNGGPSNIAVVPDPACGPGASAATPTATIPGSLTPAPPNPGPAAVPSASASAR
jgi:hypothetical protein